MLTLDGVWQVYYDMDGSSAPATHAATIPAGCDEVAVPASLNEQTTDRAKYLHMKTVWYYRRFRVPASWKDRRIEIRFGSVTYRADVYIDGAFLGRHETGYTPFSFELPPECAPGAERLLAVRVDNRLSSTTLPQGNVPPSAGGPAAWRIGNLPNVHYDFFPYTGIHRPVVLAAAGTARIEKAFWTTRSIEGATVTGQARFVIAGGADTIEVTIPELGFRQSVALSAQGEASFDFSISGITPWSPENPRLYTIDMRLIADATVLDHYPLEFGFRTVAVQNGSFLLNGQPVFMRGFGRHEDLTVIGKGLNLPYLVKDFNLMKWAGANSFRTTHYPYSEEQMQMADRQGFLIIDEAAANTLSMGAVNDDPAAKKELFDLHTMHARELIERDYNHPSVVAWSLGNECEMSRGLSKGYFSDIVRYAKTLDSSRPVTCVSIAAGEPKMVSDIEADEFDFIAYNVYPAWYFDQGRPERIGPWLKAHCDALWNAYRKPILLSEFGADTLPGLHDEYCLMWTEEYEVEIIRRILDFADSYPACCGAHVWNFADFKVGQHTGRIVLNWKGVFTRDRHPKMAAHMLRERWTGRRWMIEEDEAALAQSSQTAEARYT